MSALKELLPPVKSTTFSHYDHSKNSWFKDQFSYSASDPLQPAAVKPSPVPLYAKQSGFIPRKPEDFDDGGAFPEIHLAQYPLGIGRKDKNKLGSKILPLTVDSQGKVAFDATVRQNENALKIVYSQHKDLVPKMALGEVENWRTCRKRLKKPLSGQSLLWRKLST